MENNECILSKIDKATIKEIVGNKDLNLIRKNGRRLDEIKIFVTENIDGKIRCSNFLDVLLEKCSRKNDSLEGRQWVACSLLHLLVCQNKKIPKNIPSWVFGCPIKNKI